MSQAERILNHLRSGKHLTPLEAMSRFSCLRLSGRILELREAGYRIRTRMVRLASGKRVASYTLTH
jgi:hypothetical protein